VLFKFYLVLEQDRHRIYSHTMADTIGPDHAPKRSFGEKVKRFSKSFTTKYVSMTNPGGNYGIE
jgi:hypothetical protein